MRMLNRQETIATVNELAAGGRPFVFMFSFAGDQNLVYPAEEAEREGLCMEVPGWRNHRLNAPEMLQVQVKSQPVDPAVYRKAFQEVQRQIRYGNTFLLNLTFPTPVEASCSLKELFAAGSSRYKLLLENRIAVFSPERFIRIHGRTISSNPMKGTMDASLPGALKALTTDRKEDAEHNTIVDLIRNDLSMVAERVHVKRFKYIERIRTHRGELLQMSSEIEGMLPPGATDYLGDLLFRLLPAGSICGAPKKKTVEIIRRVESYDRGFYSGIFGRFDGKNVDSAVSIRYLERTDHHLIFKSGGGITHMSQWKKEYEEMIQKIYVPVY